MKMKNFRTAALLTFALLASGIGFDANAGGRIIAYSANNAGGKIMLTDVVAIEACGEDSHRAMTLIPNREPLLGCWMFVGGELFILWDGEDAPRYYELTNFQLMEDDNG